MIAKITDAYIRRYSDSGQVTAYVEWIDGRGKKGRTEGPADALGNPIGSHMTALFARAYRAGVMPRTDSW